MDDEVPIAKRTPITPRAPLWHVAWPGRLSGPEQLGTAALARLLESAPDGVAVLEPSSARYLYVNASGSRLLGRAAGDLVGEVSPFASSHAPPQSPAANEMLRVGHLELEVVTTAVRVEGRELVVVRFRDVSRSRQHERHLAAFSRTSASIAFAGPLSSVLNRLSDEVRRATGMLTCTVLLMDEDGRLRQAGVAGEEYPGVPDYAERLEECRGRGAPLLSLRAFHARRPLVVEGWREQTLTDPRFGPIHGIARDATWNTLATVPVVARGQLIGVLNGFFGTGAGPREEDLPFLTAIADQAAVAVENARLVGALESKAALEERHRLARDLHDSVNQALFSLTLQTRAIEIAVADGGARMEPVLGGLAEIRGLAEGALAEMRALIFALRPAALHEEGLVSAVRKHAAAVAAREGLVVRVDARDGDAALDDAIEEQVFRVAQEALHNVVKHAGATSVRIGIDVDPRQHELEVFISDDGQGFDTGADHEGHLGLESMAERIAQVGGTFSLESDRTGTSVRARVPLAVSPGAVA